MVSPKMAWALRSPVAAQAAHTPANANSADFMVVDKTEVMTVGE